MFNMSLMSLMIIFIIATNFSIVLNERISYPKARRDESVKEVKFGIQIEDPYRWLEDPNSDETRAFIEAQNNITIDYLKSCPHREQIRESFKELLDYPKVDILKKYGQKYFFTSNTGLQSFDILYMKDSLNGKEKVVLDPNKFSSDGSSSLTFASFSNDGKWLTYGISESGSDWVTIRIRDIENERDLSEKLTKTRLYSPAFTADNKGFFYSRYDDYDGAADGVKSAVPENPKLFYHQLSTDPSTDILLAKLPNPHWRFGSPLVSHDGKYLHLFPRHGTENNLWYYAKLDSFTNKLNLLPIIQNFEALWEYVRNDGELHYMRTNYKAPNYRVVAIDLRDPKEANWIDVIPEKNDSVLLECVAVHTNLLAAVYIHNVVSRLEFYQVTSRTSAEKYDFDNGLVDTSIFNFRSIGGKRNDPEVFVSISSFFIPSKILYYNFNTTPPEIKILNEVKIKGFRSEDYISKQVFFDSNDKTARIPMFIIHHKKLKYDGNNPTFLYGYGGFNVHLGPSFNVRVIFMIRNLGGVYAIANLRGGSEFGEKWHEAGMKFSKQNVFDDFIYAAEYLINNSYTSREKLIINGRSNGGLLVGAVSNQRPDLFGCALPQVGVMDMLRFHKFTIGYAWISEYGNPDEEMDFKNIVKYSPLHNIPANASRYPATLIMTADHDDRVVPMHSLKFGAQLQYYLGDKLSETPLLIRITSKAGHGRGLTIDKAIDELTDVFSFVMNSLSLRYDPNSFYDRYNNSFNHSLNYYNVLFIIIINLFYLSINVQ